MHRNRNNQFLDERNLKTLPITLESYQKEHLFIPKKTPHRRMALHKSQRPHSCNPEAIQYPNNKQTTKHRQTTKKPAKQPQTTHNKKTLPQTTAKICHHS